MVDKKFDFDKEMDKIEVKTNNNSVTLTSGKRVKDSVSSGSLVYDLITGGGFPPGRVVLLVGAEQSGKSTFVNFAIANAARKKIRVYHGDAEGATDPNYLEAVMKQYGLTLADLFGIKDKKGNYVRRPLLRHYQPDIGEPWFRLLKRTLKLLPDRINIEGKWYDRTVGKKETIKKLRKNGKIQTLWFLDSLPSLMPEDMDEDDDSKPMAQQARMYSEQFKGLSGRLARKRSTYIIVNQIREKPMVMYGSPAYEPCGNAPKHYSSQRIKFQVCAFSNVKVPKPDIKSTTYEEPSWNGEGTDGYKLVKLTVIKNKVFSPYKIGFVRLWYTSAEGVGYGIDPVFDTAMYLIDTGQMTKKRGGIFLLHSKELGKKSFTWKDFKAFILGSKKGKIIRKKCFAQIRSGDAFDKYFETIIQQNKNKKNRDEDE